MDILCCRRTRVPIYTGHGYTSDLEKSFQLKQRVAYNLRFPGQVFDGQGGLHYNETRNFDPAVGRYSESDGEGLLGGLNTYVYVRSRPTMLVDAEGNFASLPGANEFFHDLFGTPAGCLVAAAVAQQYAFQEARESRIPGRRNGPQDAFRHCTWSCKMARLAGVDCARAVGVNHEVQNLDDGEPLNEFDMDSRNNAVGIQEAQCGNPKRPCRDRCRQKLQNCQLSGLGGTSLCWPSR